MMLKRTLLSLLLILLLAGCAPAGEVATGPLRQVRLPMGYIPNVQFAPFYVAVEKGYFAAEGIEIEFDYSFETDGVQLVGAGEVPFSLASGEQVLLARAQGLPVVYTFAWYRDFPVSVIAAPELNVQTPADLRGQAIGLPGLFGASYIGLEALLYAGGVDDSEVQLEAIGFNQVESFASGQKQVVVVYTTNEPNVLAAQGIAFTELRVADHLQLVANGLITNEKTLSDDPELVRGMGRALARGILDAAADPDAAYEICKKYVENLAQADESVQKQVLAASISFWNTAQPGRSDVTAWRNMNDLLVKMGLLTQPRPVEAAFSNDYLPPAP